MAKCIHESKHAKLCILDVYGTYYFENVYLNIGDDNEAGIVSADSREDILAHFKADCIDVSRIGEDIIELAPKSGQYAIIGDKESVAKVEKILEDNGY